MRGVEQIDFLRDRAKAIETEISEGFVRALDSDFVEFHPAAVWKLHETAGGALQAFEVSRRELHTFDFPIGRNREPIDAAALDDQARLELSRRQEETVESWVAQVFSLLGAIGPRLRERREKSFIGVADPKRGLRR